MPDQAADDSMRVPGAQHVSPELERIAESARSRTEAALDIAVKALRDVVSFAQSASVRNGAARALARIEELRR